jgi:hypothetical protein
MSIFDIMSQQQSPSMGGTGGIGALGAGNAIYPQSRMDKTQYATPMQLPTSADVISSDYDPKTDAYTGMPNARFASGGDVEGDVDVSFGDPISVYMDPAYGFAHDPVYNAMMQARSEGMLSKYQSGTQGELSPEENEALKIRAMAMSGNPKYDPRYMPLRLDDRPLTPIQSAMLRLQADKQIGEGNARAGISALAAALPNRQGVTVTPSAYDVGYNIPVGPGNLDISAYRAMKATPSGSTPTGAMATYSMKFAEGGIASIPRYDGEDGSQVETPNAWDPSSGQVKLQQLEDPKDPFSPVKQLVDYTIPKDQIQNFIPNTDPQTGAVSDGGQLILKDGSSLGVDSSGIVHAATPSRNDYKLNEQGYYQPVGANLTWDGGLSRLTKNIGGVDVEVPGIFTKGGYQDPKGNLLVDENGVPIPLAPAQYDSGAGKSGLSDLAPYIAAAALGGGAALMAPSIAAGGFAGMVPASESLLGSMGYLGTAAAPTVTSTLPTTGGVTALDAGTADAISKVAAGTAGTPALPASITSVSPTVSSTLLPGAAALQAGAGTIGGTAGASTAAKIAAATLAAKALGSGAGGGAYVPASTTTTTQTPPPPSIASTQFNPSMVMPNMFAMNQTAPGMYYQPQVYRYYAQGGIADLGGYAAGGKLLKGPGDGMSDDIVANIAGKQPARLADGEFVVPADVVSHLGNGSTDAGAKHLYKMMDRIRQARTGNPKQGKRINPDKFLPKG